MVTQPKGLLLDYGGTLVEEVDFNPRAGNEAMLARADRWPEDVTLEKVTERANKVEAEVKARRDQFQLETPWSTLTRLIHEFLGIRFVDSMSELEMTFWKASVTTRAMPGAREALEEFHRRGVRIAVVSNCSFGQDVIRYELAKHGLAERLEFVMVSAEYAVRKPNPLLFDTAAAKLGVKPKDVRFVGDRLDADVAGAKAAGMTAVWFCPSITERSDSPDMIVTGWVDLVLKFQRAGQ